MEKLQDKVIVCKDCGKEFTFTVREQEFYAEKGFTNEPVRCKDCRIANKAKKQGDRNSFKGNKFNSNNKYNN